MSDNVKRNLDKTSASITLKSLIMKKDSELTTIDFNKIGYKNIFLNNFRNYEHVKFDFINAINLITGKNGVGKTNLLEAINFVGVLRGFTHNATRLVKHNKDFFSVVVNSFDNDKIVISYLKKHNKKVFVNDNEIKKISDYIGTFPTVALIPQDDELILGSTIINN